VSAVHDEAGNGLHLLIAEKLSYWNCVMWGKKPVFNRRMGCRVGWWNFYQLSLSYWLHKYTLFRLTQIISSNAKGFDRNWSSPGVLYKTLKIKVNSYSLRYRSNVTKYLLP